MQDLRNNTAKEYKGNGDKHIKKKNKNNTIKTYKIRIYWHNSITAEKKKKLSLNVS